uniref:Uncharacterized protein n=1 Tax=Dromaius novaehollandiae TaxID=8790 RepID=A0A8C4J9N1_DRONO
HNSLNLPYIFTIKNERVRSFMPLLDSTGLIRASLPPFQSVRKSEKDILPEATSTLLKKKKVHTEGPSSTQISRSSPSHTKGSEHLKTRGSSLEVIYESKLPKSQILY